MFSLKDGWRGSIGDMGGRKFGNDVKHGMDRMVGWYGWWDCIGDRIALMVGWVERMHGRDTALNGGSCNATTMHPLHHQQFNQIFPLFPSSSFGNLHQVSLQRFSSWLAVEYPSRFPHNLSCRQLKDKSLRIEIVEIKIP